MAGEFTTYGLLSLPVPWQMVISGLGVARAGPAAGPIKARVVMLATASQPKRRKVEARRRALGVVGEFIDTVPERAAGSAADESTSIGSRCRRR
jgi:hypothetical protein